MSGRISEKGSAKPAENEPWPHQPWEYIMHNIRCFTCGRPIEGSEISAFEAMVRSGVSKEEALNAIAYRRPCCRVTMTRPNILPAADVIDREIVLGRKNIRQADFKVGPALPSEEKEISEEEAAELERRALEMRAERRERALQKLSGQEEFGEAEAIFQRWEAEDEETRAAMARQGLNPVQIEERLAGVFSMQSQGWEAPALDKNGQVKRQAGVPAFQLGLGEDTLEMRDVGLRYQVRVLRRKSFFAL